MSQQREIATEPSEAPESPDLGVGQPQAAPRGEPRTLPVRREPQPPHSAVVDPTARLSLDAAILATAKGDRARFSELFNVVGPRAKSYLMARGMPSGVAEDLAMTAMVEVWRTAGSFDPQVQSGYAWIFKRLREVSLRNDPARAEVGR